jgi:antitoxin component of RelBE/YafQ-DinJ toxin-antitoxin module
MRLIDANAFIAHLINISKTQGYNEFILDKKLTGLTVDDVVNIVCESLQNENSAPTVLTIPENATNGDMIKAMFPNLVNSNMDLVDAFNNAKKWWNAPYKAEKE